MLDRGCQRALFTMRALLRVCWVQYTTAWCHLHDVPGRDQVDGRPYVGDKRLLSQVPVARAESKWQLAWPLPNYVHMPIARSVLVTSSGSTITPGRKKLNSSGSTAQCFCIYVYACIQDCCTISVSTRAYIYIRAHTHTHIYIYIYIYVCVCACMQACMFVCGMQI
jgi:hypothetical protein